MTHINTTHRVSDRSKGGFFFYRSHGALLIIHSCNMLWICDVAMWLLFFHSVHVKCYTNADWMALLRAYYDYQFGLISVLSRFYCFRVRFHCVRVSILLYHCIILNLICNIENHWLDFNVRGFFRLNKHARYRSSLVDSFKWNKRFSSNFLTDFSFW